MSTIFSGTTTGTSGNTTIQVYTLSANTGSTRTATLSVNNGEETGTVSLSQYPKPVMSRSGSGTIPASGGTVSFSVNSAYPFFFRNTPSSVSDITAGGQSYISGNVPAGTYAFDATIGSNPSTASTSDVIEMAFQRFDGAYSYTRPDAASFRVPYQQEGSDEPVVSEINVPVYFDTDGQNVFICLGQSLPFEVRGSVEITYRQGNIELCPFVFSAGESQILLSDFRGTAIPLSDFDTSLSDYKSITSFLLSNGAPEMTTAYGSDTYYIYCSKVYSSYFIGELETLGNNLDGITWGTEPSAPIDYSNAYFTIEALSAGTLTWGTYFEKYAVNIDITDSSATMYDWTPNTVLNLSAGDRVSFNAHGQETLDGHSISFTGQYKVYGNLTTLVVPEARDQLWYKDTSFKNLFSGSTTLIDAQNLVLPSTVLNTSCYENMFAGCTSLVNAPAILPATNFKISNSKSADYCYRRMFAGCTSLTKAPELPAKYLSSGCYDAMFFYCTSLTEAPALPTRYVATYCYSQMFSYCTSLTTAPVLPATSLAKGCYYQMFKNCSNLNYVKCLAQNTTNCTDRWLENVSPTGTFVKYYVSSWTTGTSGIPSGWTVETTREP